MRIKRILAVALAMLLILASVFPAIAINALKMEEPALNFYADLLPYAPAPGLYGAVENLPADIQEVFLEYSFDRESFERFEGKTWGKEDIDYLEPSYGEISFGLLMTMDESPLKECLEDGSHLFVKACALQSGAPEPLWSEAQEISLIPSPIGLLAEYSATEDPSGLYGFVFDLPADTQEVFLEYSLDGESFERFGGKVWGKEDISDGALFWQFLMGADQPPLKECLERGDGSFFVRVCAVQGNGDAIRSEGREISLLPPAEEEIPAIRMELAQDGDAPGLYGALEFIPADIVGINVEYSFDGNNYYFAEDSVWDSDELSQIDFLLPQRLIAADQEPLSAYLSKKASNLYVRLVLTLWNEEYPYDIRTEAFRLTHEQDIPLPEPPPFSAEIVYENGYIVKGHFEEFPAGAERIRPMYSLDGENYQYVNAPNCNEWSLEYLGTEEPGKREVLENQMCLLYYDDPLVGYVLGRLNQFYIRLEITAAGGAYYTQAAQFSRETTLQVSDDVMIKAVLPDTMRRGDDGTALSFGLFRVTARAGAVPEEVYGLLPETLPVEVQFLRKDTGALITSGIVQCRADWKTPPPFTLTAGQTLTIPDAAGRLSVPAGSEVVTPLGKYTLTEVLSPNNDEIRLAIDAVGPEAKPEAALRKNGGDNTLIDHGFLSLAFWQKPSGATSIEAYSYVDKEGEWTPVCNLLARRDVNYNQSAKLYGYVNVLPLDDSVFQDYLDGTIPGFGIGLKIRGGTFDGETVTLSWPGNYPLPDEIPDIDGSEGNEGNAGSGDGSGGSQDNGGQRPDIPSETPAPAPSPEKPSRPSGNKKGGGTIIVTGLPDKPDNNDAAAAPQNPEASGLPHPGENEPDQSAFPAGPADAPDRGNAVMPSEISSGITQEIPEAVAEKETSPFEKADSAALKYKNFSVVKEDSVPATQAVPDIPKNSAGIPPKTAPDKTASGSELNPPEQPKAVSAEPSARPPEKSKNSLPFAVTLLLLGGGITAVVLTATGTGSKMIAALKKYFS